MTSPVLDIAEGMPHDARAEQNVILNTADVSQELGTTGATLTTDTWKWIVDMGAAKYKNTAAVVTSAQVPLTSTLATPGFRNGLQIKATTALSSMTNGDYAKLGWWAEGYAIANWGWGAANSLSVSYALAYWSDKAGPIMLRFGNGVDRWYYVDATAIVGYNFVSGTLQGCSDGTWDSTNGVGLVMELFVAGKAASPVTAGSWGSTVNVATTAFNNTNLLDTTNFKVIGVGCYVGAATQVIASITTLARRMRSFPKVLQEAQRYWEATYDYGVAAGTSTSAGAVGDQRSAGNTGRDVTIEWRYSVPKRTSVTPTIYSTTGASGNIRDIDAPADRSALIDAAGIKGVLIIGNTTITIGHAHICHAVADARPTLG